MKLRFKINNLKTDFNEINKYKTIIIIINNGLEN